MNKHSFQDRERIRRNAAYRVSMALAKGEIKKPGCCEQCGAEAERPGRIKHWADHRGRGAAITKLEAHHADYSRPLDVVWLCRPCHMLADLKSRDVRYERVAPLPRLKPRDDKDHMSDLAEDLLALEVGLEDGPWGIVRHDDRASS
jgi:hypothetical protein